MPSNKAPKFTLATLDLASSLVPFGGTSKSVSEPDRTVLGGKGLGLQEMSKIGVDVPPGFTLTTPLCQVYQEIDDLPEEMWHMVSHQFLDILDINNTFMSSISRN